MSIRARINTILITILLCVISGGVLSFWSLQKFLDLQREIVDSYELSQAVATLDVRGDNSARVQQLQSLHHPLLPAIRESSLHELLEKLPEARSDWIKKQQQMILINEHNFQNFTRPRLDYQKWVFIYVVSLSLGLMAILLIALKIFVQKSVVGRIQDLNRRMTDFLQNRYSYQFQTPQSDELGDLQTTFNTLAQQVLENMREFQSLDSAKSEFLSIASHELRTPMTSIKGSLSLLSGGLFGKLEGQPLKLVQIAEVETDRLIRLINDLLDLAKIEAQKFPLQQKWTQMEPLLRKSAQGLVGLQQAADVEITLLPVPPVVGFIDADRVHQVITNLLSNALKFSPKGSRVRLSCTVHEDGLLIEVTDEGRGIAPEDRDRIFQKFRQATSPESPLVKGTGLGLTIAKALVEEHGGNIGVKSEQGHGSTFYFSLPKWQWLAQAQEQTKQEVAA